MGDHDGTLQIENDDITMKKKHNLTSFGGSFETLRFDESLSFKTFLGFTPSWNYKLTNAVHCDSPGE